MVRVQWQRLQQSATVVSYPVYTTNEAAYQIPVTLYGQEEIGRYPPHSTMHGGVHSTAPRTPYVVPAKLCGRLKSISTAIFAIYYTSHQYVELVYILKLSFFFSLELIVVLTVFSKRPVVLLHSKIGQRTLKRKKNMHEGENQFLFFESPNIIFKI